jgi:hypothetical protein
VTAGPFKAAWLHESLRAERQAERRLASLRTGEMDHFFHYAGVRQCQLWLDLHRRHAPVFADPAFEAIFRDLYRELAVRLAGQPVHVVALGPGGGQKEAWLLEALRDAGCRLRYTPVDASAELALLSAEAGAPFVDGDILPVVGDLSLLKELPRWLDTQNSREVRVYTAIGLLHNFLPIRFLAPFQSVLRPEDHLILGTNLAPGGDGSEAEYLESCRRILPQYDNPETRLWLRQVLVDWGLAERVAGPVIALESLDGIAGFVARATWLRDERLEFEGEAFEVREGDSLRLFFSLRYTPARLAQLARLSGLALAEGAVTACGQEGVWRVERAGDSGGATGLD